MWNVSTFLWYAQGLERRLPWAASLGQTAKRDSRSGNNTLSGPFFRNNGRSSKTAMSSFWPENSDEPVKEGVCVNPTWPSLNGGAALRRHLSGIYNPVLSSLLQQSTRVCKNGFKLDNVWMSRLEPLTCRDKAWPHCCPHVAASWPTEQKQQAAECFPADFSISQTKRHW